MNFITPTFLLCLFGLSAFVMSHTCTGDTRWRGCSNGEDDVRNFFIPRAQDNCADADTKWCCPPNKLLVSQILFRGCLLLHVRLMDSPQSTFCHFRYTNLTPSARQKISDAPLPISPAVYPNSKRMKPSTVFYLLYL
ncbi:hypothetical protein PSTT_04058, partial [Puccinia striiformis]